jgi:hypothetical protein
MFATVLLSIRGWMNYRRAGYKRIEDMTTAGHARQDAAFRAFLKSTKLDKIARAPLESVCGGL